MQPPAHQANDNNHGRVGLEILVSDAKLDSRKEDSQMSLREEHAAISDTLKDVKDVPSAMSLLKNLRDGAQISDSAHESLMKVFETLSKDAAAHAEKSEASQVSNSKQDAEMSEATATALIAAGISVPKRKSTARPFKHPSSKRQQLTSEEAAEIYSMRPEVAKGTSLMRGCMVKSKMIAPHFGVTPKTVRDIWHGRTWVSATRHLWTEEEIAHRARWLENSEDESRDSSNSSTPPPLSPTSEKLKALSQLQLAGPMGTHLPPMSMQFPFASDPLSFHSFGISMPGLLSQGVYPAFSAPLGPMGLPDSHSFGMMRTGSHGIILPTLQA